MSVATETHAIARLRAERDEWRERARQAEAALAERRALEVDLALRLRVMFGLTSSEGTIVAAVAGREVASREQIMAALYGDNEPSCGVKNVHVFIVRLRAKLARHGISITTRYGFGYSMSPADRDRLRQIIGVPA